MQFTWVCFVALVWILNIQRTLYQRTTNCPFLAILYCSWQYYIQRSNLFVKQESKNQKPKKNIKTLFSVASAACWSKVPLTCSNDISRTTCTAISNLTQLFRVPTRSSCFHSKSGLCKCITQVATNFSQLFHVWCSYSECLLAIAVAIPCRTRVNALLGLLHNVQTWFIDVSILNEIMSFN